MPNPLDLLQQPKPVKRLKDQQVEIVFSDGDGDGDAKVAGPGPIITDETAKPFDIQAVKKRLAMIRAIPVYKKKDRLQEVATATNNEVDPAYEIASEYTINKNPLPEEAAVLPMVSENAETNVAKKPIVKKRVKKVEAEKVDEVVGDKTVAEKVAAVGKQNKKATQVIQKNMNKNDKRIQEYESKLPPAPKIIKRVSNYYLANRKAFITKTNELFAKYRVKLAEKEGNISCKTQSQDENFALMTHQQVITDYLNLFTPYRGLLLYHGLGSGKCHKKGTPLMMSDGSIKKVEDIKAGETLMGDDSQPRTVLSLATGHDIMYEVISENGESYTVNKDHILCLKSLEYPCLKMGNDTDSGDAVYTVEWIENNAFCRQDFETEQKAVRFYNTVRETRNETVLEISIQEYLLLDKEVKAKLRGYKVVLDFPEQSLYNDPYDTGFLLGRQNCSIPFEHNPFEMCFTVGYRIPEIYKCNSRENRMQLLAGLIDAEGFLTEENKFAFIYHYESNLAEDILFLGRSLGFVVTKTVSETDLEFGMKYCCMLVLEGSDISSIPTRLKKNCITDFRYGRHAVSLLSTIRVKWVGEDDYYGFTLDGNGRYLMGDFTVTHNTCSSIALAEGMKSEKPVYLMTKASLKTNYFTELKKCGDALYRKNQHWEFVSVTGQPDMVSVLSSVLHLPISVIEKQGGAWMIDANKGANFGELSGEEQQSLDEQIDAMIRTKYIDLNYNGLSKKKIAEMEAVAKLRDKGRPKNKSRPVNPFHDSVVVIDEVHNLVSMIFNSIRSKRKSISMTLYHWITTAENARVVFLSGTPIINYPSEVGVLFNMLRGDIKTWTFNLNVASNAKVNRDEILKMFEASGLRSYDFISYSGNKLVVTRNPFGFENVLKNVRGGQAQISDADLGNENSETEIAKVSEIGGLVKEKELEKQTHMEKRKTAKKVGMKKIAKKGAKNKTAKTGRKDMGRKDMGIDLDEIYGEDKALVITDEELEYYDNIHEGGAATVSERYEGVTVNDRGRISDSEFQQSIVDILAKNDITLDGKVMVVMNKVLPDKHEEFMEDFIDLEEIVMKNRDAFQRRILGLTSYFRSAQEQLMPRFVLSDASTTEESLSSSSTESSSSSTESSSSSTESSSSSSSSSSSTESSSSSTESESESDTETEETKGGEIQTGGMIKTNRIYNVVRSVMSDFQFKKYADVRLAEIETEKRKKRNKKKTDDVTQDMPSSYRIFSRLYCNFVFPDANERPKPPIKNFGKKDKENVIENIMTKVDATRWDEDLDEEDAEDAEEQKAKKPKTVRKTMKKKEGDQNQKGGADEESDSEGESDDGENEKESIQKYQQQLKAALEYLQTHSNEVLSPQGLQTYSPKMGDILKNIQSSKNTGMHLIYSQFRNLEGIAIMKLVLEQNGYEEFKLMRKGGDWDIEWDEATKGPWEKNQKPCLVLYTGTETKEEKEVIRNIYNGKWSLISPTLAEKLRRKAQNNINGEIIRIFMITASGAEGISLANTRFVHIMEPYWNLVRLEQVIGRARRICSHEDLPESQRTVKVFLYLSGMSEKQMSSENQEYIQIRINDYTRFRDEEAENPNGKSDKKNDRLVTTDEHLFEMAMIKDNINKQILSAIQSTAVDCSLYSAGLNEQAKLNGDDPLVCYSFGKVSSNAYSSHPILQEDLGVQEETGRNERKVTVQVRALAIPGKTEAYVMNTENLDIYTRDNYEQALESNVELVAIGRVVKKDGKNTIVWK